MSDPHFIDANILLYSISRDPSEARKRDIAEGILDRSEGVMSVQVLQEFYVQATRATRKDALNHEIAVGLIETWTRFTILELTMPTLMAALEIKKKHRFSYWDSAIIAAARMAGCRTLYSEDMSHGRDVDGVLILDPFR
jgi:predicted nucleic acid-binding protein